MRPGNERWQGRQAQPRPAPAGPRVSGPADRRAGAPLLWVSLVILVSSGLAGCAGPFLDPDGAPAAPTTEGSLGGALRPGSDGAMEDGDPPEADVPRPDWRPRVAWPAVATSWGPIPIDANITHDLEVVLQVPRDLQNGTRNGTFSVWQTLRALGAGEPEAGTTSMVAEIGAGRLLDAGTVSTVWDTRWLPGTHELVLELDWHPDGESPSVDNGTPIDRFSWRLEVYAGVAMELDASHAWYDGQKTFHTRLLAPFLPVPGEDAAVNALTLLRNASEAHRFSLDLQYHDGQGAHYVQGVNGTKETWCPGSVCSHSWMIYVDEAPATMAIDHIRLEPSQHLSLRYQRCTAAGACQEA